MERLTIDDRDGCIVVVGDIDSTTETKFREALSDSRDPLRIDLSGCTFMDSTGISALVDANNQTQRSGQKLHLISPSQPVLRLLDICGLTDILTIQTTTELP